MYVATYIPLYENKGANYYYVFKNIIFVIIIYVPDS